MTCIGDKERDSENGWKESGSRDEIENRLEREISTCDKERNNTTELNRERGNKKERRRN